jgi:hypothetical protein
MKVEELSVSDDDGTHRLSDIPALAAVCIVTTTITLIVALTVNAPIQVTAPLAAVLAALVLYIRRL